MKNSQQIGIGTGSGTLLSALAFLGVYDIAKTVVLAAIGAVVSFVVSWLLQRWLQKRG
ncbi:hypothetical protein GCM10011386_33140 [Parapedobacter defluvii]|uniref:Holin n=1 Tax=Parapedobacter defluvii TaxID=2045106 RepID=A0ABQ1MG33_9SPHI|nr:hypothetical protein [Parapedobacter defluvii]GGC38428.1 hypothetical protein GCM10011386_33140 [Parapedobacter defluvii]